MYDASATTTLVARAESDRDRRVEHVDVVEIEDALIGWTRDGTVPDGGMLSDARLRIAHGDVADVIQKALDSSYDLVLLDVDNGPGHLVYADNAAPGLLATMRATFESATERAIGVRVGERAEQYFLYLGRAAKGATGAR